MSSCSDSYTNLNATFSAQGYPTSCSNGTAGTNLGVETPTFTAGSYTLAGGDANKRLLIGG